MELTASIPGGVEGIFQLTSLPYTMWEVVPGTMLVLQAVIPSPQRLLGAGVPALGRWEF